MNNEFNEFISACAEGNLNKAQQLLLLNPNIYTYDNENDAFNFACFYGHLHVVQWLLQVNPNYNCFTNLWFEIACAYGQLHVAQWLLQVNPNINISANNNEAFWYACENGHLNVVQWLQTLNPFKYSNEKVKNNFEENLVFILYGLKSFNYNLSPSLTNIICTFYNAF